MDNLEKVMRNSRVLWLDASLSNPLTKRGHLTSVMKTYFPLDNPNVWFEVGYAIAASKDVIFICSEERRSAFPFDVQHRTITKYGTASPRDFKELQRKVTERLKATLKSN